MDTAENKNLYINIKKQKIKFKIYSRLTHNARLHCLHLKKFATNLAYKPVTTVLYT